MNDLLPCPFCGSSVIGRHKDDGYHLVQCAQCGCEMAHTVRYKLDAAWNRRALPAASQPEAEPVAWAEVFKGGKIASIRLARDEYRTVPLYTRPAPVVPADGLDAERLVAAWLDETEVFSSRRERLMDDILAECDLAPWFHAACQVGIDAALRAQQPAAPVSGVTVKPLVWDEEAGKSYRQANCIFGQYQVSWLVEFECWQLSRPHMAGRGCRDGFSRHSSKDDAKLAAQADYERLIRSAIVGG